MMAAATGVTYLFRATGSVLGISLSNVILQNSLATQLKESGLPKKVSRSLLSLALSFELARSCFDPSLFHRFHRLSTPFVKM